MLTLGNLSGLTLSILFTRIIVHPDIMHRKHCSSQYYSLKLLFILHNITITETTSTNPNIHKIHTGTFHHSYQRHSLPMKLR
jgi:hypothetical protein